MFHPGEEWRHAIENSSKTTEKINWQAIPIVSLIAVVAAWRFGQGIVDHLLMDVSISILGMCSVMLAALVFTESFIYKRINSTWLRKGGYDSPIHRTLQRELLAVITGISTIALIFVSRELYSKLPDGSLAIILMDYTVIALQIAALIFLAMILLRKISPKKEG